MLTSGKSQASPSPWQEPTGVPREKLRARSWQGPTEPGVTLSSRAAQSRRATRLQENCGGRGVSSAAPHSPPQTPPKPP